MPDVNEVAPVVFFERLNVFAPIPDPPFVRRHQPRQEPQQRRFPRAVGPRKAYQGSGGRSERESGK